MQIVADLQTHSRYLLAVTARITYWLMVLLICLLPVQLGTYFFQPFSYVSGIRVDYLAPSIYLTDIITTILIVLQLPHLIKKAANKKMVFLLVVLLVNSSFSIIPWLSAYASLRLLMGIALYYIYKQAHLSSRHILLALLAGGMFEIVLSVLQMATAGSLQGLFYFAGERYFTLSAPGIAKASLWGQEILRPYGTFSHPNSLGGFYLLVYIFVLTSALFRRSRYIKYAVLFISAALVFISLSKTAFAALLILSAVYLARNKTLTCALCKVARITGLSVLFLLVAVTQTDPLTITKRAILITQSLQIFIKNPILGVGLGNYLVAASRLPPTFLDTLNQPVHSIYLLLLTEIGIVGVSSIGVVAWPFFKKVLRHAPYILAAILITGGFDHYWITLKQNSLLLGVLFGLLL